MDLGRSPDEFQELQEQIGNQKIYDKREKGVELKNVSPFQNRRRESPSERFQKRSSRVVYPAHERSSRIGPEKLKQQPYS
ncbi:MAG: hypothetical protein UW95_C0005G0023 [Parcubacteria group bacterium GW2011_GWC1_45_14]|nr:MAG: hypothetical protein UW95_C0005G0023 [Parcubacteria group bacterium GW2011_GWC1_45_14]